MKHLILFIFLFLVMRHVIIANDKPVYKSNLPEFIDLSYQYDWMNSYYYSIIREHALRNKLSVKLICAIIQIESGGRNIRSRKNKNGTSDFGLMQINSAWNFDEKKLMDPEYNIEKGCMILRICFDNTDNNFRAISMYNTGIHAKKIKYEYVNKILKEII